MRWGSVSASERGRTSPDSYSSWVELVESVRWFVGQRYSPFKWMRVWVSFSTVTAWNMVQQWSEQNVLFSNSSIYTCSEAQPAPTSPLHSPTEILHLCYSSFSPPQDENIHDVLQLLVALMSEHPASMIPAFDQRNGIRWLKDLMSHEKLISLLNVLWCRIFFRPLL